MYKTRNYLSLNNLDYINFQFKWFDGNKTNVDYVNPWAEKVPLCGTDSVQNQPFLDDSTPVMVYVPNFQLVSGGPYTGSSKEIYGLEVKQYAPPEELDYNVTRNPDNAKYYSDKFNGLKNLTSI